MYQISQLMVLTSFVMLWVLYVTLLFAVGTRNVICGDVRHFISVGFALSGGCFTLLAIVDAFKVWM